jgi:hypothetical protein
VIPVRYKLISYILFRIYSVFKGLMDAFLQSLVVNSPKIMTKTCNRGMLLFFFSHAIVVCTLR